MSKLLSLGRNLVVLTGLLVLLLVTLIWFVGPRFGLIQVNDRIVTILILIVAWTAFIFIAVRRLHFFQADDIQGSTNQTSAPSANLERGEPVDAFKAQLDRAVQWLRNSKLRTVGLPWYILIGPPASGKSMLLGQSNLDFPYTDPDKAIGRRGIEPTKSCDLWIANEALFIDTSGHYSTDDNSKQPWLALLDQIRRSRKDKALEGVILLVDIASVLRAETDDLKDQARKLRSRLDEMTQKFGMVLPVYLVFNKVDKLEGFVEFFNDLEEKDRTQVWGCTLEREQYHSLQPHQEFEKEFDRLYQALVSRRLVRLTTKERENKGQIYSFPLQLSLAREQLLIFITALFQPNMFRERPIFRGFYFTSGHQETAAVDLASEYMNRTASLPEPGFSSRTQGETRSYFINRLLTQVVFPDPILAGFSSRSARRSFLARLVLLGCLAVLLPILSWLVVSAYLANQAVLAMLERARVSENIGRKPGDQLQVLQELRSFLERFDEHKHSGSVNRFQWGMYIGDEVLESARMLYANKLKQVFVDQCGRHLMRELSNIPDDPTKSGYENNRNSFYLLKTFLMLSKLGRADEDYLLSDESRLSQCWKVQPAEEVESDLQRSFYVHLLSLHPDQRHLISANEEHQKLILRKQEFLGSLNYVRNLYYGAIYAYPATLEPIYLSRTLEGSDRYLFEGDYQIPAIFTRRNWETHVGRKITEASEEYDKKMSWVLGRPLAGLDPDKPAKDAMLLKLSEIYFDDYQRHWRTFLSSIKFRPFANRHDATDRLGRLSAGQGPIYRLFKTVSHNTFEELEGKLSGNPSQDSLVKYFQPIHQFMTASNNRQSPISEYLGSLQLVYREFYANAEAAQQQVSQIPSALSLTAGLLQNFTPDMKSVVEPILKHPINMALKFTPAADAQPGMATPPLAPLIPPGQPGGDAGSGLIVSGIVTSDGRPVENTVVYLLTAGSTKAGFENLKSTAKTDERGKFTFPKRVPAGKYCVFVEKRGFRTAREDVDLTSKAATLRISLEPE